MSGAMPLLLYTFMVWTRKTLLFYIFGGINNINNYESTARQFSL
jgi:hypothetical protein